MRLRVICDCEVGNLPLYSRVLMPPDTIIPSEISRAECSRSTSRCLPSGWQTRSGMPTWSLRPTRSARSM